jgi:beta-N-acetylhexosaminidase
MSTDQAGGPVFCPRFARRSRILAAATVPLTIAAALTATTGPATASGRPGRHPGGGSRGMLERTIAHMSLAEKVGQLFVTYAYGTSADTTDPADVANNQAAYGVSTPAEVVQKYHLGGVIYFNWTNSANEPHQIAGLSNGLQLAAAETRPHIPLLVSTDQEQGIVARVGPPATQFPGNMAIGATRSTADAYTAAHITGQELRAIGINQDFAPVSDVNVNARNPVIGVRSFGSDPQLAAAMASREVDGYQDANVASTAKHFPGHGDTDVDSHTGIPIITHTREQWQQIDLPPFQADIRHHIDAIMTAHIVVPALDPSGDPATLSHPIITGILRDQLHYDGVVITDSLGMQGVRDKYGDDRVPVLALKAGVDMLLMPPDMDLAYNSVLQAVRNGEISKHRIDTSVYRVLRLKYERGLFRNPFVDPRRVDRVVGTPDHLAAAQSITDRSVTLIKNDQATLPLATNDNAHVLVTGWGAHTTQQLGADISARGVPADVFYTGSPNQATIDQAVARAKTHDLTIVTTQAAWNDSTQVKLVKALLATGKPIVVVAVRDPYDIAYFPDAPTYVATYSYTDVGVESLTRVLFGQVAPTGKLPVMVPAADDPDQVLFPYGYGLSYQR